MECQRDSGRNIAVIEGKIELFFYKIAICFLKKMYVI